MKLCIVGDWGTDTLESYQVVEQMQKFGPDYTIHLGNVYYVGDDTEIRKNFLGDKVTGDLFTPVKFLPGRIGTFTIPGNHEMYGGGESYFTKVIGKGGCCDTESGVKQSASYFCLES